MSAAIAGPIALGAIIGYLLHYLVRRDPKPGIKDLSGIIAAIVGGAVLKVLEGADQVNWYLVGLGIGFFLYWAALLAGAEKTKLVAKAVPRDPSDPVVEGDNPRHLKLFPFLR